MNLDKIIIRNRDDLSRCGLQQLQFADLYMCVVPVYSECLILDELIHKSLAEKLCK